MHQPIITELVIPHQKQGTSSLCTAPLRKVSSHWRNGAFCLLRVQLERKPVEIRGELYICAPFFIRASWESSVRMFGKHYTWLIGRKSEVLAFCRTINYRLVLSVKENPQSIPACSFFFQFSPVFLWLTLCSPYCLINRDRDTDTVWPRITSIVHLLIGDTFSPLGVRRNL